MFSYLNTLNVWYWLGFGILLLGIELYSNKAYFFFAALLSGFIGLLQSLFLISGITQCVTFLVLLLLIEYGWFKLRNSGAILHRHSQENYAIAKSVIGKTAILSKTTRHGHAKILLDGRIWHVRCQTELLAGTTIVIIGHDGVILLCQKA